MLRYFNLSVFILPDALSVTTFVQAFPPCHPTPALHFFFSALFFLAFFFFVLLCVYKLGNIQDRRTSFEKFTRSVVSGRALSCLLIWDQSVKWARTVVSGCSPVWSADLRSVWGGNPRPALFFSRSHLALILPASPMFLCLLPSALLLFLCFSSFHSQPPVMHSLYLFIFSTKTLWSSQTVSVIQNVMMCLASSEWPWPPSYLNIFFHCKVFHYNTLIVCDYLLCLLFSI